MGTISRITALTGAFVLGGTVLLSGVAAQAAPIDAAQVGSIIVHKHVEVEDNSPKRLLGAPLEGVEFSVQQVLHDPDGAGPEPAGPIDMTTAEGWALAEQVFASDAPDLPANFSLGTAAVQNTNASGIATFSNLKLGAYLVTETGPGNNLIFRAAAPFWVSIPMPTGDATEWNYNVDVFPKNTLNEFTPTKKVTDHDLVDPDGKVEWTVFARIPASMLAYQSLSISDPVATGLNFQSFGDVILDGDVLESGADYTVSGTVITFTAAGLAKVNAVTMEGPENEAMVSVVVNTDIKEIPENGAITNTATVTLNGVAKTAPGTTNWGELLIQKNSSEGSVALAGATFELYTMDDDETLYAIDDETPIATGTTDADGRLQFDVWVGNDTDMTETFWLKEIVAPAGHVLPADPWTEVTVNAGQATDVTVTIVNHKAQGPEIPLTGGTGAALLTLAGIGVLSVALIPSIRRRKAQSAA